MVVSGVTNVPPASTNQMASDVNKLGLPNLMSVRGSRGNGIMVEDFGISDVVKVVGDALQLGVDNSSLTAVSETVDNISVETSSMEPNTDTKKFPVSAKVHHGSVRSGQQISAENSSLVIIGSVNSGGEVLADGDIHIYGRLKGRALASLGRDNGKIFVSGDYDPELICIEGTYATGDKEKSELNEKRNGTSMVYLDRNKGQLKVQTISTNIY
mmetsp:Transcript_14200/g.16342  ORF Transcript_14200/g.16342 Transcript_14200/m.16342 type:complete len:213 (-) Transcript_14200:16-654(-)